MATQNEEPFPSTPNGQIRIMGPANQKYRIDGVGVQENGDWWIIITIFGIARQAQMKWTDIQGDVVVDGE